MVTNGAWVGECAIEKANRPGARRCRQQCDTCNEEIVPLALPVAESSPTDTDDERAMREDGVLARYLTTFETCSGLYFDFAAPAAEHVCLEDIARALSMICRFGGHVDRFYSVAEHAVRVMWLVEDMITDGHAGRFTAGLANSGYLMLGALHHDDHEAYVGDWPTPLKRAFGREAVDRIERPCNEAIGKALGIDPMWFEHPLVREADVEMRYREASSLKVSRGVGPDWGRREPAPRLPDRAGWMPWKAQEEFLHAHRMWGGR